MFTRRVTTRVIAVTAAAALVVAACGSDDSTSTPTSPGSDATTAESVADTAPDTAATDSAPDTVPQTDAPSATDTTGTDSTENQPGDVCTEDHMGGELSISIPSLGASLDPFSPVSSLLGGELVPIYDSLMRYDASTGEFLPQMAESATPNDTADQWTVVLRPDITFGNGDPLDAAAVKASMERHFAEGSISLLSNYASLIDDISVDDNLTLTFTLSQPWGSFPTILTRGLGYVTDVAVVDQMGGQEFGLDPSDGAAGPYKVDSFNPPESIVFTARDDYWGGPLCIQKITYTAVPLGRTAVDSFERDEFDAALIDARDPVAAADAKELGTPQRTLIQNGGGIVILNARDGGGAATVDPRVRRAIAAAIDVDAINERAFDGRSYPESGIISDASQLYSETDGPAYDPDLAASLIDEAKGDTDWDGSVRFACVAPLADASIAIQAMLEAAGFTVDLQSNLTLQQEIGIVLEGNYELACFGQTPDEGSMWDGLRIYSSTNPRNLSGFSDPAFDAALETLGAARTVEETQTALDALQVAWNDSVPAAIYSAFEHVFVVHDNIHGLYYNDTVTVTPYFDKAYVD